MSTAGKTTLSQRVDANPAAPAFGAVGATLLWEAGNLVVAGAGLPGAQLALFRVLTAMVLYQGLFRLRGGRMSLETIRSSLLGGFSFGASAIFMFAAMQTTTVASATVIASLQPVLLLPYSILRLGESVSVRRISLTVAAVLGTVVSILGASTGSGDWSLLGDFCALLGTVFGCLYFIGTKTAREKLGSLEYQAAAMPTAALVALVSVLVIDQSVPLPSAREMIPVVVLVLVPGSGHLLMSWAQKHMSVSATSTIALDITLLSSIGAVFFFDQTLTVQQVVGMLVTLTALAFFLRDTTSTLRASTPAGLTGE